MDRAGEWKRNLTINLRRVTMLVKKVLFLFAALFAICATAEAKTTTDLRAEDHGVLGAMQRMGCTNPQWLGRVLLESNIPIGRVYKLPVGAPIVIPDECEKGAPLSSGDMMMNRAIYGEKGGARTHPGDASGE